jgi:hypothetical protein
VSKIEVISYSLEVLSFGETVESYMNGDTIHLGFFVGITALPLTPKESDSTDCEYLGIDEPPIYWLYADFIDLDGTFYRYRLDKYNSKEGFVNLSHELAHKPYDEKLPYTTVAMNGHRVVVEYKLQDIRTYSG